MKRVVAGMLLSALLGSSPVWAETETKDQRVSPPPVQSANVYDGVTRGDLRVTYMDMDFVSGGGVNLGVLRGFTDKLGAGFNLGVMGLTGSDDNVDISIMAVPVGIGAVYELLGGNVMDAAGQIKERHATLSAFAGLQAMITMMTIEMNSYWYSYSETETDTYVYGQGGLVGEIPVISWLSLTPYGSVMFGETTIISYGGDILVRPFRNAPNWEISVGTVLQQIEANDKDSLTITVGVTYTQGEHHRSIQVGPAVR